MKWFFRGFRKEHFELILHVVASIFFFFFDRGKTLGRTFWFNNSFEFRTVHYSYTWLAVQSKRKRPQKGKLFEFQFGQSHTDPQASRNRGYVTVRLSKTPRKFVVKLARVQKKVEIYGICRYVSCYHSSFSSSFVVRYYVSYEQFRSSQR